LQLPKVQPQPVPEHDPAHTPAAVHPQLPHVALQSM
jgi:hypothetical protein